MNKNNEKTQIFLNAYLQAEVIKGLKYKLNLGLRKDHTKSRTYTGAYDLGTYGKNDAPDLSEGSADYESWVLENTLNYDKIFGKHNLSALVGYSAQKDKSYGLNGSNTDIPEFIETMTGNVKSMTASSSITNWLWFRSSDVSCILTMTVICFLHLSAAMVPHVSERTPVR